MKNLVDEKIYIYFKSKEEEYNKNIIKNTYFKIIIQNCFFIL